MWAANNILWHHCAPGFEVSRKVIYLSTISKISPTSPSSQYHLRISVVTRVVNLGRDQL
jgi:hypothetical protein